MNKNKIGNVLNIANGLILLILSIKGLIIGVIISSVITNPGVLAIVNSAMPFFYVYLVLSILTLIIAGLCFMKKKEKLLGEIHLILNLIVLIFTIIISILNMPLIIGTGVNLPIIAFATTFTLYIIASIIGIIGSVLKIKT